MESRAKGDKRIARYISRAGDGNGVVIAYCDALSMRIIQVLRWC